MNIKPVEIVTIKNKISLFKGEEQANSIEYIELEEIGNKIVAQKGLYEIGDKAIFIEPDYSLPDIPLFESFHRPGGDPKKCILGSNGRIRAKKFTLHIGDGSPIYSYGILLPYKEVEIYLKTSLYNLDLTEKLGVTKWEEPEPSTPGLKTKGGKNKPSDMYTTDEDNINKLWNGIKFPIQLTGREKIDGSSISLWYRGGDFGICSRNMAKSLTLNKVTGRRSKTFIEKILFWKKPDLNIYQEFPSDDQFVVVGKPYLDKLVNYCKENNIYALVLRGELNGKSAKGSGNKNNPSVKEELNIKFFGIDDYTSVATKVNENQFNFHIERLGFTPCKEVFYKLFNSREELEKECNDYFKNNLIEGIVVRNFNHTFSAKIMNLEYDSKK